MFEAAASALLIALHTAFGLLLLRRRLPGAPLASIREPHWLAAYPLGLVANTIVAFSLDVFLDVPLHMPIRLAIAVILAGLAAVVPRGQPTTPLAIPEATPWSSIELGLAAAVALVLGLRHGMGAPLSDWDSVMYHLPLAEVLRGGHFSDEIGRSYIRQYEAAFPPMLFFHYASLPEGVQIVGPRVLGALVDAAIAWLVAFVAMRFLGGTRRAGLMGALGWVSIASTEPDTQSLTTVTFLLTAIYGLGFFARSERGSSLPASDVWIVVLLGASCYWNSYLGAGLLAVLYPAMAIRPPVEAGTLRDRSATVDWGRWALAATVTIALLLPHMARNWIAIGNPLYPALVEILGGADYTEWFLENRPEAGTGLANAWSLIALSFQHWRPWPQLALCGLAAALLGAAIPRQRRAEQLVLLGGFFLVWMVLYQRANTPNDRFLYPVGALAAAAIAHQLDLLVRHPSPRAWLLASPLVAIAATAFPDPDFLRNGGIPALPFVAYLSFWTLGIFAIDARFGATLGSLPDASRETSSRAEGFRVPTAALALGLVVLGGTAMALRSDTRVANTFRVPISDDLDWMNENLAADATVLLFDGRIWGLERRWIPLDDARLEPFGQAPNRKAAHRELAKLGITHFYFSEEAAGGLGPSFDAGFFVPRPRNARVELLHRSETGWVVELRAPAPAPP